MAAKYDFYKTPVSKDSTKRPRFHARIVSSGTIDTDDLAKRIHGHIGGTVPGHPGRRSRRAYLFKRGDSGIFA